MRLPAFSFPPAARDRRGAVLVEFALALPLLALLLFGILAYGQYFLLAHEAQQAANDAARAAIAGLNAQERAAIAEASVAVSAAAGTLGDTPISTAVSEAGPLLTVRVAFDARPAMPLDTGLVPLPDPRIERQAVMRLPGAL